LYWELRLLAAGKKRVAQVGDVSSTFTVTTRSEHVRAITLGGEATMLARFLQDIDGNETVWDVGACVGTYACFAAQILDEGEVVAFEPDPTNRHHLRVNLSRNASPGRWTILPAALFDRDTELQLQSSFVEAGGGHHFVDDNGETVVEGRTGTSVVERGFPSPDVVKIDVQGAELRVLSGMEQLFPQIETIYLEVHETKTGRYDTDTEDIEAYLRDHGFTLESLGTPSTKRGGVYFLRASQ